MQMRRGWVAVRTKYLDQTVGQIVGISVEDQDSALNAPLIQIGTVVLFYLYHNGVILDDRANGGDFVHCMTIDRIIAVLNR